MGWADLLIQQRNDGRTRLLEDDVHVPRTARSRAWSVFHLEEGQVYLAKW